MEIVELITINQSQLFVKPVPYSLSACLLVRTIGSCNFGKRMPGKKIKWAKGSKSMCGMRIDGIGILKQMDSDQIENVSTNE